MAWHLRYLSLALLIALMVSPAVPMAEAQTASSPTAMPQSAVSQTAISQFSQSQTIPAQPQPAISPTVGTGYLLTRLADNNPISTNPKLAQKLAVEPTANSLAVPSSILRTGTNVTDLRLSPNAIQLADQLGLIPLLQKLPALRANRTAANVQDRMELLETREEISEIIQRAQLDVQFVMAELYDEEGLYSELSSSYSSERDKKLAYINATSFGTNGVLWAVCEALDIPTYKVPTFSISSGITGILAGIIPSIASAYTLKAVNGPKHTAPASPNMLAKLFDRPVAPEIEYPKSVWDFLNSVPADEASAKKSRKELIIDRWISDSNIPAFTDRSSSSQIDNITASIEQHKSLTIGVLGTRLSMLQQLGTEVFKMNRLLLELSMALRGDKAAG